MGRRELRDQQDVITSYSIHYTKLYEDSFPGQNLENYTILLALLAVLFGLRRLLNEDLGLVMHAVKDNDQSVVITSYSIHYTKLYDGQQQRRQQDSEHPPQLSLHLPLLSFTARKTTGTD